MSRGTQKLHELAKLCRSAIEALADSSRRLFSRSPGMENGDPPRWLVFQDRPSMTTGIWHWIRGNPIWVASLVVVLLGLLGMRVGLAHRRSVRPPTSPNPQAQSKASKTEAKKAGYASTRADANLEKAQVSSEAERQQVARRVAVSLQQQGIEDVLITIGGQESETLILSSKIFQDSARRDARMKIARIYWKNELCKSGFKAVVLDGMSLFGSSWHEYPLQCPKTPGDRVSLAAGLQADFEMAGKAIQVHATGPNEKVLSLIASTDGLQREANRTTLFQQLKEQGIVRRLCAWDFRQVSIQNNSPDAVPSVFSVDCASH
jgi:hypothetical protein